MTPAEPRLGPGEEFDRIRSLARILGPHAVSLGDDCALLDFGGEVLAVSVDQAIENVHFRRDWLSFQELGWRSAAGALSDLAAVGATPVGILTAIGAPTSSVSGELDACMQGIGDLLATTGGVVLGGDLTSSPVWTIGVTVLGRAARPILRSGAEPGDSVWVSGELGGSRAALETWVTGGLPSSEIRSRFAVPKPRLAAGAWLAANGAHAMIDLSDGLGGDLRHLAAASEVHVSVDLGSLPIHAGVAAVAAMVGEDPAIFAATGGEDYELLVALPSGFAESQANTFEADTGISLTRIGGVEAGGGVTFKLQGRSVDLTGYDHFR